MKKQPLIMKNRINSILKERGFNDFTPTDELLKDLQLTRIMFFKFLKNTAEPAFGETKRIANWLKVSVNELYEA